MPQFSSVGGEWEVLKVAEAIELVGESAHRRPTNLHRRQLILPGEQRERGRWPAAPLAASGPEGALRVIEVIDKKLR